MLDGSAMPRWTRDRSLGVLPRAGPHVTPRGFRVPPALLWHLAVERAQRHGVATLADMLRLVGVPRGATRIERTRVMRLLTADDVLWVCGRIERRIAGRARRSHLRARYPLDASCSPATTQPISERKNISQGSHGG